MGVGIFLMRANQYKRKIHFYEAQDQMWGKLELRNWHSLFIWLIKECRETSLKKTFDEIEDSTASKCQYNIVS